MSDEEIEKMWTEFKQLLESTKREGIENIIEWLDKTDFKIAPASTKYHDNIRGGLLKHSLNVYHIMMDDFSHFVRFFDIPNDSLILMSLLHDVCKVQFYKTELRNVKNDNGEWIKVPYYTVDEIRPYGHGDKSVIELQRNGLKLNDLEIGCIRNHMGFSDQEYSPRVSNLFSKCPQSLVLWWADCASTFIAGSCDLQPRFRQKLFEGTITKSLDSIEYVTIQGTKYKRANRDEIDNLNIIEMVNDDGEKVAVYSPHKDGLPI